MNTRTILLGIASASALPALIVACASSSDASNATAPDVVIDAGSSTSLDDRSLIDGSTVVSNTDGSSVSNEAGTGGPGPIVGGLQFPFDTIPTTVTKPFGGPKAEICGIKSMQYTWAFDLDGGLERGAGREYTFWDRSASPQPGDGEGYPIYWTYKGSPKSLMCVMLDSGTSNATTLYMFLGKGELTPEPYPGQEAVCSWELIPHPDKNDKRFALRSGMTVPGGGKASYLGSLHAGGAQSRQTIVVGPTNIISPTNIGLVPWFTLQSLGQVVVGP